MSVEEFLASSIVVNYAIWVLPMKVFLYSCNLVPRGGINDVVFFFSQGHCFVAVNPNVFADGFEDRMQALMDQYRNLQPVCFTAANENINKRTDKQTKAVRVIWERD